MISMITTTSAVNLRQQLGDILNQVQYRHDSVVIKRDGKPIAALIDHRLFERIRRLETRFDALSKRLSDAYSAHESTEAMQEIDAIVAEERSKNLPQ